MGYFYDAYDYLWTFDEDSKKKRQQASKTLKTGGVAVGGLVSLAGFPEVGVPVATGAELLGEVIGSYKKGVRSVPRTGVYRLHKGERVLSVKQKKALDKMKVKLPK